MVSFRIYLPSISPPDFFCLANVNLRVFHHVVMLKLEFGWEPQVIRIQKSKEWSAGKLESTISRRAHSGIFLLVVFETGAIGRESFLGFIGGSVVNDNELKIRHLLGQN